MCLYSFRRDMNLKDVKTIETYNTDQSKLKKCGNFDFFILFHLNGQILSLQEIKTKS